MWEVDARRLLASSALGATLAISAIFSPARAGAQSYPIDCAILLCLAGGFPASSECSAARIELIRRITPWPIEPPLQLWNCPMSMSAAKYNQINMLLAATGQALMPLPDIGPDGLTPDIRRYRDGIEIYHVRYRRTRNSGGEQTQDDTQRGAYDDTGQFAWASSSLSTAPAWVVGAIGGQRAPVHRCVETESWSRDGEYCVRYELVSYSYRPPSSVRAVAIRMMDHEGSHSVEVVHY